MLWLALVCLHLSRAALRVGFKLALTRGGEVMVGFFWLSMVGVCWALIWVYLAFCSCSPSLLKNLSGMSGKANVWLLRMLLVTQDRSHCGNVPVSICALVSLVLKYDVVASEMAKRIAGAMSLINGIWYADMERVPALLRMALET